MRYRLVGKSGLRVSELCLGAMTFGTNWGWGSDEAESRNVFDTFAEAGGTFIDTAYIYTDGVSERMLGDFVRSDRSHFVVSTKYGTMNKPDVTITGSSRKAMRHAVDESLRRLGTDYIDLYWIHAWDVRTPVEELMRAMDDLVTSGKVLYIGVSNAPAWEIARANMLADLRGWSAFVGLQTEYNLLERTAERELLPMAHALDLTVTAWSPLAGGILSGKYSHGAGASGRRSSITLSEREAAVITLVDEIAAELGATASAVALATLRQLSPYEPVIPLLGARTADQLRDNLECLNIIVPPARMEQLQEATAITLGTPHDMLTNDYMRRVMTGDAYDRLDNHRA